MSRRLFVALVFLFLVMSAGSIVAGTPAAAKQKGQRVEKAAQTSIGYRYAVLDNEPGERNSQVLLVSAKEPLTETALSGRKDYPAGTIMYIYKGDIAIVAPIVLRSTLEFLLLPENTVLIIDKFLKSGGGLPPREGNLVLVRSCGSTMPISTLFNLGGFGEDGGKLDLENGTILSPTSCLPKQFPNSAHAAEATAARNQLIEQEKKRAEYERKNAQQVANVSANWSKLKAGMPLNEVVGLIGPVVWEDTKIMPTYNKGKGGLKFACDLYIYTLEFDEDGRLTKWGRTN
jgi:hypothetical protein